jgi:hypothetical protein
LQASQEITDPFVEASSDLDSLGDAVKKLLTLCKSSEFSEDAYKKALSPVKATLDRCASSHFRFPHVIPSGLLLCNNYAHISFLHNSCNFERAAAFAISIVSQSVTMPGLHLCFPLSPLLLWFYVLLV